MEFGELIKAHEPEVDREVQAKLAEDPAYRGYINLYNNRKSSMGVFYRDFLGKTEFDKVHEYIGEKEWLTIEPKFRDWLKNNKGKLGAEGRPLPSDSSIASHVAKVVAHFQKAFSLKDAMDAKTFAERFNRICAVRRVSQNSIIKGAGTAKSIVYTWKRGLRVPDSRSRPVIEKIEDLLEVPRGTLTVFIREHYGKFSNDQYGMAKHIMERKLNYSVFISEAPKLAAQFECFADYKLAVHTDFERPQKSIWTYSIDGTCNTKEIYKQQLEQLLGFLKLKPDYQMPEELWQEIKEHFQPHGVKRAELESCLQGLGLEISGMDMMSLTDIDYHIKFEAFVAKRRNILRRLRGEVPSAKGANFMKRNIDLMKMLFNPRWGYATQCQSVFDRSMNEGQWLVKCRELHTRFKRFDEGLAKRSAKSDTNAFMQKFVSPKQPMYEFVKFLRNFKNFIDHGKKNRTAMMKRLALYVFLANFPLRKFSFKHLHASWLKFDDRERTVSIMFPVELLKNGRRGAKRFKDESVLTVELYFLDRIYNSILDPGEKKFSTYDVLKDYITKWHSKYKETHPDRAHFLFPTFDDPAFLHDTRVFSPSKTPWGSRACRNIVASHADQNFNGGDRIASDLLLNTVDMIHTHYAKKTTEQIHSVNKDRIDEQLKSKTAKQTPVKSSEKQIVSRVTADSQPVYVSAPMDIIERLGGIDKVKRMSDRLIELALKGYDDSVRADVVEMIFELKTLDDSK